MKVDVKFEFLEKRNYIHSTSMTYSLISQLIKHNFIASQDDLVFIDAAFRKENYNNGYFLIDEEAAGANTVYSIKLKEKKFKVYYMEYDSPVLSRVPYDENKLVEDAVVNIEDASVTMPISKSVDNLYNILVAATKKMITKLFPQDDYTPWTLARFSLNWSQLHNTLFNFDHISIDGGGNFFTIKLVNNLDDIYLKSDVFINNEKYGSFYNARHKRE